MAFIHDKSDSYFESTRDRNTRLRENLPVYARAKVLRVLKSNDPNNPNLKKIIASFLNNRTFNNFSEQAKIYGDTEELQNNPILLNVSQITVVMKNTDLNSEPAPGDEISVILVSNEDTKNLGVDGYLDRIIKQADNVEINKNKDKKENLKNAFAGSKNNISGAPISKEDKKKFATKVSISSPIDQTLNKIKAVLTEDEQYDFYKNIITKNGGNFFEEPTKKNVLAIRIEDPVDRRSGIFNDRMVMVWINAQNKKRVETYVANTESTRVRRKGNTSRSASGVQAYYYSQADHPKYKRAFYLSKAPLTDLYVDRVLNPKGTRNGQHMIHYGKWSNTNSKGCQTLPPKEYERFWKDFYSDKPSEEEKKGYYQQRSKAVPGKFTYYIILYENMDKEMIKEEEK